MERKYTNRRYLDALQKKVLVFDGAMGTSLQEKGLTAQHYGGEKYNGCIDYLVLSYPQVVEDVHRSFLEVGVDVIETNSFRANRITLNDYDLAQKSEEINYQAARLARIIADEYSQSGIMRYVAGSMGPSGKLPSMNDPELSNISFDELADVFREQAIGLLQGGVDLILIETSQDILEIKAQLDGIQAAFLESDIYVPIQVQVSLDTSGKMLLGTDISAVLSTLEDFPIDVIGLNCSTGPEHMRNPIQFLGEYSTLPVSCIPNAGLPLNIDGKAVYPLEPQLFASQMSEFVEKFHVNVVGGCCGTTPDHLRLLVNQIANKQAAPRILQPEPRLSSGIQAMSMVQEPAPFLIGERLNTQGSRKFKRLIMDEDFDSILVFAQEQVDSGAHGLDICTALTERPDEGELMRRLIKILAPTISVPLVIDSTEPDVIEIGLKTSPGRCLINSTNLESGRQKADKIFNLAKRYNAAIIVLTIDESGMAKTAQRKMEIAARIFDIAIKEHGLKPKDLVYDALTFTLGTGDAEFSDSAIETLEGIKKIKQHLPGVLTSLGVSNVSFGLAPAARPILNSVMLYHAVKAGLDMAIVNPAHIKPYAEISQVEIKIAEDLIFNKHPQALQELISYFENSVAVEDGEANNLQSQLDLMAPGERIYWKILHRKKEGIEQDIDGIILESTKASKHSAAVEILNSFMLPAMKEVGDRFGRGELILPFVLQSAEVMKKSVNHLEKYLEKIEGVSKGLIVLATVYGDVHDIGKNLVKTILVNNGYEVIDLGKQVPAGTIIDKAIEVHADAIGLSALLVSTSKQMPLIINELSRQNLKFPVLIGGAAINRKFGRRISFTEDGTYYSPGVFYCKDAFEGLSTMDNIRDLDKSDPFLEKIRTEAEREINQVVSPSSRTQVRGSSDVTYSSSIPVPPGWGVRVVQSMPLDEVFQHLSKNELFRLSWGAKNTHGEEWERLQAEFEKRLEQMRREAIQNPWLFPKGIYGYWPAQSCDQDLILYDPKSILSSAPEEIMRFSFPRQSMGDFLCLADYFAPQDSDIMDVVAFQIVTVGNAATERFDELQLKGNYSEAYFHHGLAVQTAEATADFLHNHIRKELNLEKEQGKRYSWGYPAIPDLGDHEKVFKLLPAENELMMKLTPAFQLVPEQSTAAIIIHHPDAKYYSIGENRIDQLMK